MSLFSWISNLFRRSERNDFYRPRERMIFRYWDGQKEIAIDPMTIYKGIMNYGPEMSIDYKVSQSPMKDASVAHDRLIKRVRQIFSVKPFEEGGLTEVESLALLDHFMAYCDSVKKNSNPNPTSLKETSEHSVPSSAENQPTTNISDSGLTDSAPCTDKPSPLPSV